MTDVFPYRTPALLKVDSGASTLRILSSSLMIVRTDWGSLVLITSDALIERDPGFVYPSDVHFTGTQLFVGHQLSYETKKRTLP